MNRNTHIPCVALSAFVLATAFAISSAYAQVDNPPKSSTSSPETGEHQHEHQTATGDMSNMSGMHDMPATVTRVDHKSGIVEVESGNMKLKVHFPSNTITDLNKGDRIKLHLGYSKE